MRHEEALNVQTWRWQDAWERKRDYETYYTLSHVFGVLSQELFDRTARPGACICSVADCLALLLAGDRPHRCVYVMAASWWLTALALLGAISGRFYYEAMSRSARGFQRMWRARWPPRKRRKLKAVVGVQVSQLSKPSP